MKVEEAQKIFWAWQAFMEIWDKFNVILLTIPPSFYPYPPKKIEEALEIMEKLHAGSGNIALANTIQETRTCLWNIPEDDSDALEEMYKYLDAVSKNSSLKETLLENLSESRERWLKLRDESKILDT